MANQDIKLLARESGVKLWQIAESLKITDTMFSKRLRHELPDEKKAEIRSIIKELKESER